MALALVGGAALSAFLQVLFDRALPKAGFFCSDPKSGEAIDELRERLSRPIWAIKLVLDEADVEDMQVMKPAVRWWLNELARVLYDVEDLLDDLDGENIPLSGHHSTWIPARFRKESSSPAPPLSPPEVEIHLGLLANTNGENSSPDGHQSTIIPARFQKKHSSPNLSPLSPPKETGNIGIVLANLEGDIISPLQNRSPWIPACFQLKVSSPKLSKPTPLSPPEICNDEQDQLDALNGGNTPPASHHSTCFPARWRRHFSKIPSPPFLPQPSQSSTPSSLSPWEHPSPPHQPQFPSDPSMSPPLQPQIPSAPLRPYQTEVTSDPSWLYQTEGSSAQLKKAKIKEVSSSRLHRTEVSSDPSWLYQTEASDPRWLYEPTPSASRPSKYQPPLKQKQNAFPHRLYHLLPKHKKQPWVEKLQTMCESMDYLLKQMSALDLKKVIKEKSVERLPTTALPDENILSGRNKELAKILEFTRRNTRRFCIISISGMPGVGKTSLSQHVYNDATLMEHFNRKAWVCVSDDCSVVRLTKIILQSVSQQYVATDDLNLLQQALSNSLSGMKFLLVLDDVWNVNFDIWDALLKPFKEGPGPRPEKTMIIVTTRHEHVSRSCNADLTHRVELLSSEDCYTIVKTHCGPQIAENTMEEIAEEKLENVAKQIAEKCKGLPLAAKAAGRLLRSTSTAKWECILDSYMQYLAEDDRTGVLAALRLSYQYLPSHLKPCFSYCSLYPQDYEYDKKKLILLWMAEGFVGQPQIGQSIEEEGEAYFSELCSRSFFQQSSTNTSRFVMHDLFHELAQFVSKDFFCRVDHKKVCKISSKIRHLSYERHNRDNLKKLQPFNSLGHLRSLIAIDSAAAYHFVSLRVMNDFLPMLKCVRVLSLSHYQIYYLSDAIGELNQLHFLDVSFTMIKHLPKTIINLKKLQTLLLSNCSELIELPPNIERLTSLRHLDLAGTAVTDIPSGLFNLSELQTLGKLVLNPSELPKLRKLKYLQGDLQIFIQNKIPHQMHTSGSYIKHMKKLEVLELNLVSASAQSSSEFQVLHVLKPHTSLKKLSIQSDGKTRLDFPNWVSSSKYSNVKSLDLVDCCCLSLPPLGQLPSLKHLLISGLIKVEYVGAEFYGGHSCTFQPFRSLVTLIFKDMLQWKKWNAVGGEDHVFSDLQELYIRNCPMLSGSLPMQSPSLEKLIFSSCPMLDSLPLILPPEVVPPICSLELSYLPQLNNLPLDYYHLSSLRALDISNCSAIHSFPDLQFPPSLRTLRLYECNALQSLPKRMTHIVELAITGCPSLKFFPGNIIPTSLKILKINHCGNLQFIPFQEVNQKPSLVTLEMEDSCESLSTFALDFFPELYHLKLSKLKNLESLCVKETLNHDLESLHQIYISDCAKLQEVFLPAEKLPTPNLKELTIFGCPSLKALPKTMLKDLGLLETIKLDYNPGSLTALQWHDLPLPSLVSLSAGAGIIKSAWPHLLWYNFSDLKRVKLDGLEVDSFPELIFLPSKLTALTISGFPNLKCIDNEGIINLQSLEELFVEDCPRIASVPEIGFPASLLHLQSTRCPLLGKDILGKGRIKVAYIPCVIVDYIII